MHRQLCLFCDSHAVSCTEVYSHCIWRKKDKTGDISVMILKKQKVEEHLSSQFLCKSGAPNIGKLQLGGFLFFLMGTVDFLQELDETTRPHPCSRKTCRSKSWVRNGCTWIFLTALWNVKFILQLGNKLLTFLATTASWRVLPLYTSQVYWLDRTA